MDQQLLLGILLIIVGVALGLIAAAVVVNRRIDATEQAAEPGQRPAERDAAAGDNGFLAAEGDVVKPAEPDAAAAQGNALEAPEPDAAAVQGNALEAPEPDAAAAVPASDRQPAPDSATADGEAQAASEAELKSADAASTGKSETESPDPTSDSLLGELHLDPATGALVFRSGAREYRSAADIADRSERERLASAAADWFAWFRRASVPKPVESPQPAPTAGIVQAIDAILQRSLEDSGVSSRGVRLIQDASGGVKVLIGVKSYEVEQVPDDEIRNLIRQAVAEWEARQ